MVSENNSNYPHQANIATVSIKLSHLHRGAQELVSPARVGVAVPHFVLLGELEELLLREGAIAILQETHGESLSL